MPVVDSEFDSEELQVEVPDSESELELTVILTADRASDRRF